MTTKHILFVLALLPVFAFAQDDFGTSLAVSAEKKFDKKFTVGIEAEMRTRNDMKTVDRWLGGMSASYKLTSWLKFSASYQFIYDNNERVSYYDAEDKKVVKGTVKIGDPKKCAQYWGTRHRFNVALTGTYKMGNLGLSIRERWQYTYRPQHTVDERWSFYDEDWDGEEHTYSATGKNVLRSRLQASYKIKDFPATPYANVELFNAMALEKVRYNIGADWKINKKNEISMFYRYQKVNSDDTEGNIHLIGLEYKVTL